MNRYNIRIDGEVMPNSYTYEELLLNDILDFDDIEVKQVTKSNWTNIKSFYFPEEHTDCDPLESSYMVDENGQVHFNKPQEKKKKEKGQEYVIDEFGQVVSSSNIGGSNSSIPNSRDNTSTSSSTTTSSSSSDNGTGWKIFFTIVAIIIFIVITATTGWGSIPAGIVGYYTLKTIWGDDL